jgi:hypothetical protein
MIVAIAYHNGDLPLMRRWANHVAKLGSYPKHTILLAPVHQATTQGVLEPLSSAFGKAIVESCYHTQSGWPLSCNLAFEQVARYCETIAKEPFLWMEPDAVPLKASWIDDIEAEYIKRGQFFMGDYVGINGIMPNGVDHMSGIAVYHWDLSRYAPSIYNNEFTAWDIASAHHVIPRMARTELIHHDWIPEKKWRRDVVDASCVRQGAVIYHPDKQGVLFNDGLSPNGVQGDPATGAGVVVVSPLQPHETKDKPQESLDALIEYAKQNNKNKKELLHRLVEAGIIKAPKTSKRPRGKVRKAVVKHSELATAG